IPPPAGAAATTAAPAADVPSPAEVVHLLPPKPEPKAATGGDGDGVEGGVVGGVAVAKHKSAKKMAASERPLEKSNEMIDQFAEPVPQKISLHHAAGGAPKPTLSDDLANSDTAGGAGKSAKNKGGGSGADVDEVLTPGRSYDKAPTPRPALPK